MVLSFTFACIWAPFYSIAILLFKSRYGISDIKANRIMGLLETISLVCYILVGKMADISGRFLYFILTGSFLLFLSHLLILLKAHVYLISIILGVSGPLISLCLPSVTILVRGKYLGLGFSIMSSFANLAFTISPLIVAHFTKLDRSYKLVEIYMVYASLVGIFITILLFILDRFLNVGLNERKKVIEGYINSD